MDNTDLIHDLADLSTAVGRALHALRGNVAMLSDGLHALQNDRPHITEEFCERTIESLQRTIVSLENLVVR